MLGMSQITIEQFSDPLIQREARGFANAADSSLYFYNSRDEIYRIQDGLVTEIEFDCPSSCDIGQIAFDNDGNLLVGSKFGGLFRIIDEFTSEIILDENIEAFAMDAEGNIYAGTDSDFSSPVISIFRNNAWEFFGENTPGINSAVVNDVKIDSEGTVWFATSDGLVEFDGDNFINRSTPALSDSFRNLEIDEEDNVWVVSSFGGIGKFDGEWTIFEQFFNSFDQLSFLALGSDGSIWTTQNGAGVHRIFEDEITLVPFADLGLGSGFIVRGMTIDKMDRVWVSLDFSSDLAILSVDMVSSNNELKEIEDFKLFPNPNLGSFTTSFNFLQPTEANLKIFDENGNKVHSQILDKQIEHNYNFILDELPTGKYYLRIESDGKWKSYPVLIAK